MEKISSTSQKNSLHKEELPPPGFKNFNKALNKKKLFPLDKKSASTSWNKEFVKKIVFTTNIWQEDKTVFQ